MRARDPWDVYDVAKRNIEKCDDVDLSQATDWDELVALAGGWQKKTRMTN